MFDFSNYTYSAIVSILSTLFGLSYPLIIGCIEKIDTKYASSKLSERFLHEQSFKGFKTILIINLIAAVLCPFLMDGCAHSRLIICIQCILVIIMVLYALLLFSKIMAYYTPSTLQKQILHDYHEAVKSGEKAKEETCFTQWVDLSAILLSSADDKLVQSVYEQLAEYVALKYKEHKGIPLLFDQYFYDGISRINEFLCKGERKPISVNNSNSILTSLIFHDSIVSDTSYRYLWRNLRVQLFYNRDEWLMEYWKAAAQKINLFMKEIYVDLINDETGDTYTEEQVQQNKKQRNEFLEFHIMFCAMLLQQKKYELVSQMLSFTQSEPPSYPLVPSTIRDILRIFNELNSTNAFNSFYLEGKYQMPNMHGITEGKIIGAANCYLALLTYRLYVIRWNFGYESILSTPALPGTLAELNSLKNSLETFKRWLVRIDSNKELLKVVLCENLNEAIHGKSEQYNNASIDSPSEIADKMIDEIDKKMETLRIEQPLDYSKVKNEVLELGKNIVMAMKPYGDLLGRRFTQDICYNLNSSVTMPFPNTAFVKNPDIGHSGIADCMSTYMLENYYHLFASSFYAEHPLTDYIISSEHLFEAIDNLKLSPDHYVVSFGFYWDYYLDRVNGFLKESDHKFVYKGVKILSLNCNTELFSQMVYVLRFEDRPFLTFYEPSETEQRERYLSLYIDLYGLWTSLEKIVDHPELLNESVKKQLGDEADKYSLFSSIWAPKLFFKPKPYIMKSIKVKYRLSDEGNYDDVSKVTPFDQNTEVHEE